MSLWRRLTDLTGVTRRFRNVEADADLAAALARYDDAVKRDVNDPRPYVGRGNAYALRQRHREAIDEYTRALRLTPGWDIPYERRGSAYLAVGEFAAAVHDFDRLIELHPDSLEGYAQRSLGYMGLGQYELAVADATRAIELECDDWERSYRYEFRATVHQKMGRYDRASADWAKADELCLDAHRYEERGYLRMQMGDYAGAVADFERFMTFEASFPQGGELPVEADDKRPWTGGYLCTALYWRAECLVRLGRVDEALRDFERLARAGPYWDWSARAKQRRGELR